jgi:hypothetical protein
LRAGPSAGDDGRLDTQTSAVFEFARALACSGYRPATPTA